MLPQGVEQYIISGSIINNTSNIQIFGTASYYPIYFRSDSNSEYIQINDIDIIIDTNYYQFKLFNNANINYSLQLTEVEIDDLNIPEVEYNSYHYPYIQVTMSASLNVIQLTNANIQIYDITSSVNYTHTIANNIVYDNNIYIYYCT